MDTPEEVAADILERFSVRNAAGSQGVPALSCGTSDGEVWVVFRSSDELSGSGDTRYGLWIDINAARAIYCFDDDDSLADMIWYAEIEVPQPLPDEARAMDNYWFDGEIYWSHVP